MAVTEVTLAGLVFNSGSDGDGDEFIISDVQGWDGTGVELVHVERPLSSGAVLVRGRRASRTLTVSGWVVASSGAHLGRARHKLETAFDGIITTDGTLEVDQDNGTYTLTVRLAQQLRTRTVGDMAVTFEADLIAVSPAKVPSGS
jgi:hypothetical protein